jgi:tellurite resistance protein
MSSVRIERLRDTLLRRGMVTSSPPPSAGPVTFKPEQLELARRVRPFAEAMYLVVAVDSNVGDRERDLLRGALRTLTDNMLSSAVLDTMMREFESARGREGIEQRLDAIASALYWDPFDAELALELAIAAAEVDGRLDAREQSILKALAERLGISERHVDELLHEDARVAAPARLGE